MNFLNLIYNFLHLLFITIMELIFDKDYNIIKFLIKKVYYYQIKILFI